MRHLPSTSVDSETVCIFVEEHEKNLGWLMIAPNNDMWSFDTLKEIKSFVDFKVASDKSDPVRPN